MNDDYLVEAISEFNQEKHSDKNSANESVNYKAIIKELTKEFNILKERLEKTERRLNIHINEYKDTAHEY
ncbi:hypothetical protein ACFL4Z_01245 [candidate division KSB1 bacterium]